MTKKNPLFHTIAVALLWILSSPLAANPSIGDEFTADNLRYKITSVAHNEVALLGFETTPTSAIHIDLSTTVEGGYIVTSVADNAFNGETHVVSLKLSEFVKTIGENAFRQTNIDGDLDLSYVTSFGPYAFANLCASKLGGRSGGVTFSSDLKSIPEGLFYNSRNTGDLDLKKVTEVGATAFYRDENKLSSFKDGTLTMDNVKTIGSSAFHHCGFNDYIAIPEGVTTLPSTVFAHCSEIPAISLPSTLERIDAGAFKDCKALTSIILPASLETIGANAFDGCDKITTVVSLATASPECSDHLFPNGKVLYVPADKMESYEDAVGWKEFGMILEPGHPYLRYSAPSYTEEVEIPYVSTINGLQEGKSPSRLEIPSLILHTNGKVGHVTKIEDNAFYARTNFTGDLIIPYGVTTIGYSAFAGCSGFNGTLTIPSSVTSIGELAFSGCAKIKGDLIIPSSVGMIKTNAFLDCTGFEGSLDILNGDVALEIGTGAFYGCENLSGDLVIPSRVKKIGNAAFEYCTGFKGSLIIADEVTEIGTYAFYGCNGFTGSLTIPSQLTKIAIGSFGSCSGLNGTLTIHEGVTEIGSSAFNGCSSLRRVSCDKATPIAIPSTVFSGCPNTYLDVPVNSIDAYAEAEGWKELNIGCVVDGWTYFLDPLASPRTAKLAGCPDGATASSFTIPTTVGYGGRDYDIVGLADKAFKSYTSLTSLFVPWEEAPAISAAAFDGLELDKMMLCVPEGAMASYTAADVWKEFGTIAAPGHPYLKYTLSGSGSTDDPYVASIDGFTDAFKDAGKTIDLVIPPAILHTDGKLYTVTAISNEAFNCDKIRYGDSKNNLITSIDLPATVTSIGFSAFNKCDKIVGTLDLSHITTLGEDQFGQSIAFYDCEGLTKLILGEHLSTIPSFAFYDCSSLDGTLDLSHVTKAGRYAFAGCSGLDALILSKEPTELGNCTFNGCSGLQGTLDLTHVKSFGDGLFFGCENIKMVIRLNRCVPLKDGLIGGESENNIPLIVPKEYVADYAADRPGWAESKIGCEEDGVYYFLDADADPKTAAVVGCKDISTRQSLIIPASISIGSGDTEATYTVNTIADGAFKRRSSLIVLAVPWATAPTITDNTFEGLTPEKMILAVPSGASASYKAEDHWKEFGRIIESGHPYLTYTTSTDGDRNVATITGFIDNKEQADLVIPRAILHDRKIYIITAIGDNAFKDETIITTLDLAPTVTSIGANAFDGCSTIEGTLDLNQINTIGDGAFRNCRKITMVKGGATPITMPSDVFAGVTTSDILLDVPKESVASYDDATASSYGRSSRCSITSM